MKTWKKVAVDREDEVTCDRCGLSAFCDTCEGGEFLSHGTTAGFDSIFGDGNWVSIDLCQGCVSEVLGLWLKVNHEAWRDPDQTTDVRNDL